MKRTRDCFRLYPALDLVDGRAVRLLQGQFDVLLTSDHDDVLRRAEAIWAAGSTALHVIDLDAARTGAAAEPNASLVAELARTRPEGTILQVGGGLRTAAAVEGLLAAGVDRVLIGTLAFRQPRLLTALLERHAEQVAVAVDARGGTVRIAGWLEDSGTSVSAAVLELVERGVVTLLVTGIERDGSLTGPDLRLLETALAAADGQADVIAAGGITTPEDVAAVRALGCVGAVVGRALLEQPDALAALIGAASQAGEPRADGPPPAV